MKLSGLKLVGRYKNNTTGVEVNVHRGRWMTRGVDITFYYRSGKRVVISDRDFYHNYTKTNT